MSAVSNRVTPRSMARWITLREVSRSVRWPKLLQPRPTAETRRPEPPRLRICMIDPVGSREVLHCGPHAVSPQGAVLPPAGAFLLSCQAGAPVRRKKMRARSDAATDGGRLGRVI